MAKRVAPSKTVVLRFNDRNYNPGQWEAWCESEVIAHSMNKDSLQAAYPGSVTSTAKDQPGAG